MKFLTIVILKHGGYAWNVMSLTLKQYTVKPKTAVAQNVGKKRAVEAARIARLKKYGSLKKNYPTITSYLNKEKNIDLDPDGIASKAKNVVNWKCPKGHEWVSGYKHND